jgi:hypothetical protein
MNGPTIVRLLAGKVRRSDGLHRRVSSIRLNHKNSLQGKPVIAGQTKNQDISNS